MNLSPRKFCQAVTVAVLLILFPAVAAADNFVCFPTCSSIDARMLSVAGTGGNGLVQVIDLRVAVPADQSVVIDVFDGESDAGPTGNTWDTGATTSVIFTLFADPNGDGTGSVVVAGPVDGSTLADNDWSNIVSMANDPAAESQAGNFVYRLEARLDDPSTNAWSNFKVRTQGLVSTATLTPIPGIFSIAGPAFSATEFGIVLPNFPAPAPTTYDGQWDLFVEIPNDLPAFQFFDGDSDRGSLIDPSGPIEADLDTDDPNSDNLAVPPFAVGTNARPEGVAFVTTCATEETATSCPADDRSPTGINAFFQRSPSIQIRLITPSGEEFLEDNPSGELEWEKIRLSTTPGPIDPSVDDFLTTSIPPGRYVVRLEGLDLANLNAFSFAQEVVGVCQGSNTPCRPTLQPFLLGDTVFLDLDGNGVQDVGEPGIGGVIVNLRGALEDPGNPGEFLPATLISSTVTDASGNYSFGVPQGNFTVEVSADNFSPPAAGGAVGDRVWFDIDGGGSQDVGEPGLANVTVELWQSADLIADNGDDVLLGSTRTDANGNYAFTDLPPGNYYTEVADGTLPAGLALSGGSDPSAVRTILTTEVWNDLDFGYTNGAAGTVVVGDRVWFDANGNGSQEAGEVGISGVSVDLIDVGGDTTFGTPDDVFIASTSTVGGYYLFTGVAIGPTYVVTVTDVNDALGGLSATTAVTTANFTPTGVPVALLDKDFGYTEAPQFSITDQVWIDTNSNGVLDGAEAGIDGVTVNLLDFFGNVIATATTSTVGPDAGVVSFGDLPPGSYSLEVTDLGNVLLGAAPLLNGRLETTPAAINGLDVTLEAADISATSFGYGPVETGVLEGLVGTTIKTPSSDTDVQVDEVPQFDGGGDPINNLDYDFGYIAPGSLGDRVWFDVDGDMTDNGGAEPGLAGVTVTLTNAATGQMETTVTDINGFYSFDNLRPTNSGQPGDVYVVTVDDSTLPTGFSVRTFDLDGTGTPDTTDAPLGTQAPGVGEDRVDADFGYRGTGSIGNRVWEDANGDQDQTGENGINGVTVELLDASGDVIATDVTSGDGNYLFDGLPPGDYTVRVVPPVGFDQTFDLDLTLDNETDVTLGLDENREDVDFGYRQQVMLTGSIGDRVWNDVDGDGVQDAGEDGINDVTVRVFNSGGGMAGTTMTAGDGDYLFEDLAPDTYTVVVDASTLPAGFVQTFDIEGPLDDTAEAVLGSGEDREDVDFGYADECLPEIDFETDGEGNGLTAGQVIASDFSAYGISVSTSGQPAMIFDSSNPTGGDHDLGTPNETFNGPGIGSGGESGEPGQNSVALGNVLILSEDGDSSDPDDDAGGGTITFDFAYPVRVESVGILDIDEGDAGTVTARDGGGSVIGSVGMANNLGNNSVQTVALGVSGVRSLEIHFPGSGALSGIVFCPEDCTPIRVRDDFEVSSFSNNDGPDAWSGDWIENDPEVGGAGPSAGQVKIHDGFLTLDDYPNTGGQPSAAREVDLSGAASATASFTFLTSYGVDPSDAVTVEVSNDGGATWSTLEVITGIHGAVEEDRSYDISAFISSQTQIRFRVSQYYGGSGELFCLAYLQIETDCGSSCEGIEVRDDFEVSSFSNNDGPDSWSADWIEDDPESGGAGPSAGQVKVHDGFLTLDDYPNTGGEPSAAREVDLSGAANATMSFKFLTSYGVDYSDAVTVEISSDGGATWTTLEVITGIEGAVEADRSYDISAHISSQTQIRFRVSNKYGGSGELFCVAYLVIETDCGSSGSSLTVLDEFNSVSFGNNDGPDNWLGNWIEYDPAKNGDGPAAGTIEVYDNALSLWDYPNTGDEPSAARAVDLSGRSSATFSFDWSTSWGVDTGDTIEVEVSSDGGSSWTLLQTLTGFKGENYGSESHDISSYISADTQIRYRVSNGYGRNDEWFSADNVKIEAQ